MVLGHKKKKHSLQSWWNNRLVQIQGNESTEEDNLHRAGVRLDCTEAQDMDRCMAGKVYCFIEDATRPQDMGENEIRQFNK